MQKQFNFKFTNSATNHTFSLLTWILRVNKIPVHKVKVQKVLKLAKEDF